LQSQRAKFVPTVPSYTSNFPPSEDVFFEEDQGLMDKLTTRGLNARVGEGILDSPAPLITRSMRR